MGEAIGRGAAASGAAVAAMDGDGDASGDVVDCILLVVAATQMDEAEVEEMEEMAEVAAAKNAGGRGDGGAVFPWHAAPFMTVIAVFYITPDLVISVPHENAILVAFVIKITLLICVRTFLTSHSYRPFTEPTTPLHPILA